MSVENGSKEPAEEVSAVSNARNVSRSSCPETPGDSHARYNGRANVEFANDVRKQGAYTSIVHSSDEEREPGAHDLQVGKPVNALTRSLLLAVGASQRCVVRSLVYFCGRMAYMGERNRLILRAL